MSEKLKVYLDTSVPSAYYDNRQPERLKTTQLWWKNDLAKFDVIVSEVTIWELEATPDSDRRRTLLKLVEKIPVVRVTPETKELSQKYMEAKVIPNKFERDALHIAAATINKVDVLASWNFGHMVNHDTRIRVSAINMLNGYREIKIESPLELGGGKYAR